MIAPDMATLLVFACTDANVGPDVLDYWTRSGAEGSFNCITVDGDTSTNDSLIVLAGGAAANPPITDIGSSESQAFGNALTSVLRDLAIQVVMDAEGSTKLIQIEVSGAADRQSARQVAFTIANSPLVKTAFFGEDANWGRIVAAAGRSGVPLIPERASLLSSKTFACSGTANLFWGKRSNGEPALYSSRKKYASAWNWDWETPLSPHGPVIYRSITSR